MDEHLARLIEQRQLASPHKALGLQAVDEQKQVIRLWRPETEGCHLEICGKRVEAEQVHQSGLYELEVSSQIAPTDYRIFHENGKLAHDPYAFGQVAGELDLHLAGKGLHYELYNLLGSTLKVHQGVSGTRFALWAPNAASVFLIGDFNGWNAYTNPMSSAGGTGIWEIFIPGLSEGEAYQYVVVSREGDREVKADPVAHYAQLRPGTASVVADVDRYHWGDEDFLAKRGRDQALNIYELYPGAWKKEEGHYLNYREMAHRIADYCIEMHYTHVELMGICEHPYDESWGYQVTGYFAPTSRYGKVEDFQYMVDVLHQHGIGVLLDWVPAHFPIDDHALARFDGTYLYEHLDPRQGYHPDWNTHIFNFGRFEVSNFLIASALFWLEKMHIDGLRVDAVASMIYLDYGRPHGEWVPNHFGTNVNLEAIEFMKHMNSIIHQRVPDALMIAEESTTFPGVTQPVEEGGLGFDLKWNLGWMNDTLRFFATPFEEREGAISTLLFTFSYAFDEKFVLVLSHDEVVHGKKSLLSKMPGSEWEQFASLRTLLSWMICFPGKNLLFMGGEIGQVTEWNCKEELPWHLLKDEKHEGIYRMVSELNELYLKTSPLSNDTPESFEQRDPGQNPLLVGYFRKGEDKTIYVLHNFTPNRLDDLKLPFEKGEEIFNTDREEWGGSGILNSETGEGISVAPLATLIFAVE